MAVAIAFCLHAGAAFLFGLLALWHLKRPAASGRHHLVTAAFGATAFWALAAAIGGWSSPLAHLAETVRNLVWLGFAVLMLRGGREPGGSRSVGLVALSATLAVVLGAQAAVDVLTPFFDGHASVRAAFAFADLALRLTVAIGALVLVHNLYTAAAPDARWGIRLQVLALGAMWTIDLNTYTAAYLAPGWSGWLFASRALAMIAAAPLFGLAARRNDRLRMRLSRTVAFQSLSLAAIGGYLIGMVVVVRVVELVGGDLATLLQVTVVFGMTATALTLLPSGRLRAWAKVKVVKHFFQHRYDYRSEWLRFTDTLALAGEGARPLDERVVKAIADIAGSPGGLLLSRDGEDGGLVLRQRWHWPQADVPAHAASAAFADTLARTGWILALDRPDELELATPEWMLTLASAWAAVPLVHLDRLIGLVVLERPRVLRALDWEDLDLLRVAGRQAASYLAEQGSQEALSEARRFDEFNRRFAFIMHDLKNLVSGLDLVARNAERHADKPAFRADMVATLNDSTVRMKALLEKLSPQHRSPAEEPRAVPAAAVARAAIGGRDRAHPIAVTGDLRVLADPVRLEQALAHLVQNAIEASPDRQPIELRIGEAGGEAQIAVIDRGQGMSAEFIRTQLFRSFASTKPGGFGIGAHEARALVAAMGGRLEVESEPGLGSRFTITLPLADAAASIQRHAA